jgi:long-chain acyl-CoA synthetase
MLSSLRAQLREYNVRPSNVVAAIGGNSQELWTLLEATEDLGLVLAVLNANLSEQQTKSLLEKIGPRLVIGYDDRTLRSPSARFVNSWLTRDANLIRSASNVSINWVEVDPNLEGSIEGAVVFCTSGSTGEPKCVVSTRSNRDFCVSTIGKYLELSFAQKIISALPPSFDYGFYQGLLGLHFGLSLDLVRSPQMTGEVVQRLRKTRDVVLPLTPFMAANLCRAIGDHEEFPYVDVVTLTGGPVSLALRLRLSKVFKEAKIFMMYGLTECKRVSYLDPRKFLEKTESCGKEMAGVNAEIVDSTGSLLPPGQIGELLVTGDNVCLGYWNDLDETAKRFRADLHSKRTLVTGDLFMRDPEGYLEFVGRRDRLMKLRDERVSLLLVERELRGCELVLDIDLQICEDDFGTPRLSATVVPKHPSTDEADIIRAFKRVISNPIHMPNHVKIADRIVLNEHGKRSTIVEHPKNTETDGQS